MRVREHTSRCGSKVSPCLVVALALSVLSAPSASASAQTLDGTAANVQLGRALAMQGGRLVVGELVDGDETVGRAHVYDVRGASPRLEATLSPFGPENAEHFGSSVEIDGDRVFVGAPDADAYSFGAVYVFERQSDGRWLGVQRLTESPRGEPPRVGGPDNFGGVLGVQIVSVGEVLAVSAPYYDRWRAAQGAVVFFTRDAGTGRYTQALLVPSPASAPDPTCSNCELFGYGLAFDGRRLAASNGKTESVYVWDVDTTSGLSVGGMRTLSRASYADAAGPRRDLFGLGLAFAGSTLLVGARNAYVGGLERGAVLAIDEASGAEELVVGATMPFGTLPGTPSFGSHVVADGDLAAIGGDNVANVRVLERVAGGWRLGRTFTTAASYARFGSAVELEAGLLAIGAPNEDTPRGAHAGRVYLHALARLGETCNATTLCASATCERGTCVDALAADAGAPDAGPADAGLVDAQVVDANLMDANLADADLPSADASPVDAHVEEPSPVDASPVDASPVDASPVDASPVEDAGLVPRLEASCVCSAGHPGGPAGGWQLLGFAGLVLAAIRRSRRLTSALVVLGALAFPWSLARAQESVAPPVTSSDVGTPTERTEGELTEARARFQLAQAHFAAGRFAEAAEELERAYELSGRDAILYNLHLAYREMGDVPRSAEALRRYLSVADEDDLPVERRTLEHRLAALERTLAAARPAPETDRAPELLSADPPRPSVTGAPVEPEQVDIGLAPGAIVLGVGAAALAGAAVLGGVSLATLGERDGACSLGPSGDLCPPTFDQRGLLDRFAMERDAGWGLLLGGLGVAAVGTVLLVVGANGGSRAPDVTAWCDQSGCRLGGSVRL